MPIKTETRVLRRFSMGKFKKITIENRSPADLADIVPEFIRNLGLKPRPSLDRFLLWYS
ncbi:MAG: hypothetical protein JGK08_19030 [Microcoleus sp. PH2017_04_SCI_O_A]|uniref:hypothetical protein n=1 Tax=Microcoleus sp. PH2017_01_SCD_O_A TaxID=2798812 RepID=UPI001DB2C07C|nr:hypothetical protein [Microcoleus sp. PH2017_01_SCD_O_A]MCC3432035.1 hypothetical protein [Microcoleus sp. PH2017_04_SCI_O_A]